MDRVCYGPSLYRPTLLWAEFAMGRVCYGPRCPVTNQRLSVNREKAAWDKQKNTCAGKSAGGI